MTELEKAENIARAAHAGQKRDGGQPYIVHPACVAEMVQTNDEKIVAWLHDTLEDTLVTASFLLEEGISSRNVLAIAALSHQPREFYFEYIMRIMGHSRVARNVKIADLTHNISDSKDGNRKQKYLLARYILQNYE